MSNYAGKLQFRDDDGDENIGESAVHKSVNISNKSLQTVRDINKRMQKRRIQREYSQAIRRAKKNGESAKNAAVKVKEVTRKAVNTVKKHPVLLLIIGFILLIVFSFLSVFVSFSTVITGALSGFSSEFSDIASTGILANPLDFDWISHISSGFGWRTSPITGKQQFHRSVDIPADYGTEIHAAHSGIVIFAGWGDSYGYHVIIDNGSGISTKYAHCSALLVETGQTVAVGQTIALVGSTGDSTGNHLHFETEKDGRTLKSVIILYAERKYINL